MRALIFRDGRLVVDEVPDPEPDEGQVLVKTLAAGICGSDVHILDRAAQAPTGTFSGEVIWGHEFCCSVAADGRIDAASWITGKAGLDDALTAFADLKNPEHHVKILIEPWR